MSPIVSMGSWITVGRFSILAFNVKHAYPIRMRKQDVLNFFDHNGAAVAKALGITRVAVNLWPDDGLIPELRARQLHEITNGKLRFRPELYQRAEQLRSQTKLRVAK